MGREFKNSEGGQGAFWFEDGSGFYVTLGLMGAQDVPAFIEWLRAGPPKPKWRITREFDEKPNYVYYEDGRWVGLFDEDTERVEG